jgi:hypothetical protein
MVDMRRTFRAVMSGTALSFAVSLEPAMALDLYTWKKRPLVVFAPSETDANYLKQRSIVTASRSGFADRDVVIVFVVGDRVRAELGGEPGASAGTLRKRFGAGPGDFRVLLIGKDGGVKRSSNSPLAAAVVFGDIDAMPMRRDEVARSKR